VLPGTRQVNFKVSAVVTNLDNAKVCIGSHTAMSLHSGIEPEHGQAKKK
jgi:hypothetical protein